MLSSERFAICPNSLVPHQWHDVALLELFSSRMSSSMINFVASKTVDSVQCRPPPNDSVSTDLPSIDTLVSLIKRVVEKSQCHVATLLASAVYLERLRHHLPTTVFGCPTTWSKFAVAAIILAAKYLNDSSPMNKHWAKYSKFSLAEINLMELQLLAIFRFDLRFDERELLSVLQPLLQARRVRSRSSVLPDTTYRALDPASGVKLHPEEDLERLTNQDRHCSPEATSALTTEETRGAGKQFSRPYPPRTTRILPRSPLLTPPPLVAPARPPLSPHYLSPHHSRLDSPMSLSVSPAPPLFLDGFTTLYSSRRSSYSSSSTYSSTFSPCFIPRTPCTPAFPDSTALPNHHSPDSPRQSIPPSKC
ncbi:cyclin family protein [Sporobolomyces salmoneus]|uniref:cyclin family protein n=1 Tax=Sporobolomyces salmoneus TaxID=183962 RepID=UPI0031731DA6